MQTNDVHKNLMEPPSLTAQWHIFFIFKCFIKRQTEGQRKGIKNCFPYCFFKKILIKLILIKLYYRHTKVNLHYIFAASHGVLYRGSTIVLNVENSATQKPFCSFVVPLPDTIEFFFLRRFQEEWSTLATSGAFHLSELAGRTVARPVSLIMK